MRSRPARSCWSATRWADGSRSDTRRDAPRDCSGSRSSTAGSATSTRRWRRAGAGALPAGASGGGWPSRAAALEAFRFVPDEPGVAPDATALLAHHAIRERAPGDWTFRFDRAVLALDGDRAGDLSPLLARIECPVLLAAGERSWVLDATERARLAAAQPAVTMEVFPGGHHFLVAYPVEVGAALRRFLDGLVRTR